MTCARISRFPAACGLDRLSFLDCCATSRSTKHARVVPVSLLWRLLPRRFSDTDGETSFSGRIDCIRYY